MTPAAVFLFWACMHDVPLAAAPGTPAVAASPAPVAAAFTLIDDKSYAPAVLAPRRGRALLVAFWSAWCAPCLEELPGLLAASNARGTGTQSRGAALVFVNVDPVADSAAVAKVLKGRRIRLPPEAAYQVADIAPALFIARVDPAWQGEVPFTMLYDAQGQAQQPPTEEQARAIARGADPAAATSSTKGVQ